MASEANTLVDEKGRGLLIMSWVGEKVHGSTLKGVSEG